VQRVLRDGLRLRTACDLETTGELRIRRPEGFTMPKLSDVEVALPGLITACREHFASPPVTGVQYKD
jgi:CRISPR-associated protein Csb1